MRTAFVPDFELEWSGHTAFRGIFNASLVDSIQGVPLDSTHWWGPETNFFATRLAQNLFTVQGGIYADPQDPVAIAKFRDGGRWDQEANINLLREKYVVSSCQGKCLGRALLIMCLPGLESRRQSTCKCNARHSILPQLLLWLFPTDLDLRGPSHVNRRRGTCSWWCIRDGWLSSHR